MTGDRFFSTVGEANGERTFGFNTAAFFTRNRAIRFLHRAYRIEFISAFFTYILINRHMNLKEGLF
jgi:hypothetical protein